MHHAMNTTKNTENINKSANDLKMLASQECMKSAYAEKLVECSNAMSSGCPEKMLIAMAMLRELHDEMISRNDAGNAWSFVATAYADASAFVFTR